MIYTEELHKANIKVAETLACPYCFKPLDKSRISFACLNKCFILRFYYNGFVISTINGFIDTYIGRDVTYNDEPNEALAPFQDLSNLNNLPKALELIQFYS